LSSWRLLLRASTDRLERSSAERTRPEDRHLKFYELRDNLNFLVDGYRAGCCDVSDVFRATTRQRRTSPNWFRHVPDEALLLLQAKHDFCLESRKTGYLPLTNKEVPLSRFGLTMRFQPAFYRYLLMARKEVLKKPRMTLAKFAVLKKQRYALEVLF
jgi:hypothetical protein